MTQLEGTGSDPPIKRDAMSNVVLNKLYKYTALQTSFSVNNIALVNGRPKILNLKDLIKHFVEHRHDVVTRRTQYELEQAEKRAHILEGLIIASDNIDEVIAIIRGSSTPDEARTKLIERFELSEIQARAIVEMRLRQLTGLEQDKLRKEYEEIMTEIERLVDHCLIPQSVSFTASDFPDAELDDGDLTELLARLGER